MIDWAACVTGPCVSVFGEDIDYMPAGGGTVTVQLVFDEGNADLIVNGDVPVRQSNPIVSGCLSVFLEKGIEPDQGDVLMIQRTGETFTVKDVSKDGKGSVVLALSFQGAL